MRMRKVLRNKWTTALRSQEFKQGQGQLKINKDGQDFHCCLGVLACIVDPDGWRKDRWGNYRWHSGTLLGTIPPRWLKKIGLSSEDQQTLIDMNDTYPKATSFKQIATWIENHL